MPYSPNDLYSVDITRWSVTKSDWLYSLQPKMEKLYTVSKNKTGSWLWIRSWTPYAKFRLKLKKVGKPTRPFRCQFSSVQFSHSVMSDSLLPHESQHARPPCLSPTPGVHSDSRPSSQWCHPAISSSVVPFSSCPQSLPASESFPMSQLLHEVAKEWTLNWLIHWPSPDHMDLP